MRVPLFPSKVSGEDGEQTDVGLRERRSGSLRDRGYDCKKTDNKTFSLSLSSPFPLRTPSFAVPLLYIYLVSTPGSHLPPSQTELLSKDLIRRYQTSPFRSPL